MGGFILVLRVMEVLKSQRFGLLYVWNLQLQREQKREIKSHLETSYMLFQLILSKLTPKLTLRSPFALETITFFLEFCPNLTQNN